MRTISVLSCGLDTDTFIDDVERFVFQWLPESEGGPRGGVEAPSSSHLSLRVLQLLRKETCCFRGYASFFSTALAFGNLVLNG